MKKICLASYFAGTAHLLEPFFKKHIKNSPVLFIPTASNIEDYKNYVYEAEQKWQEMGYQIEILDIANTDKETAVNKLEQTDLVYISGGNTFYLLQELQNKNLIDILKRRIEEGMVYIGESAGAILAAKSITYSELMDNREHASHLQSDNGLDIVDFYIVPHYQNYPFVQASEQIIQHYAHLNLLPLSNQEAVIIEGNEVRKLTSI